MTEDATLTDYVGNESESGRGADDDTSETDARTRDEADVTPETGRDDENSGDDGNESESVNVSGSAAPSITYAWGIERSCRVCGETTERCWRSADEAAADGREEGRCERTDREGRGRDESDGEESVVLARPVCPACKDW